MAQRATSLGPKPSLFFFLFFGGFCFFFFALFFFVFLIEKKPVFPLEKGIFCLFSMFLFLSPWTFFGLPPFFLFLFLCLSLSLSFYCLFFLLVFLLCFIFVSCFCLFFISLSSLLLFHEKNNMNIFNCNFFFSWNIFSFFLVSCLAFLFQIPFSYLLLFPDFKFFLFNINVFSFKKNKLISTKKQTKKLQQNGFFMNLCFAKCEKLSFFLPLFCQILVHVQKNTIKKGISAHF